MSSSKRDLVSKPGLFFYNIYYDAGGKGSSSTGGLGCETTVSAGDTGGVGSETGVETGVASSGFLRKVTNPTTMGIAMKIKERHNKTKPTEGERL